MQTFNNLRISAKLAVAFAAMLLLLAGLAMFAFSRMHLIQEESRNLSENWLPTTRFAGGMMADIADYRIGVLRVMAATAPEEAKAGAAAMEQALVSLTANDAGYEKLLSGDDERKLYDTFKAAWAKYQAGAKKMLEMNAADDLDGAHRLQRREVTPAYEAANTAVDALVDYQTKGAAQSASNSESTYSSAVTWLLVVGLLAAGLAAWLGLMLTRAISRPLAQAVAAADRVASGDLSQTIDVAGKDEMAQLLSAMQRMQASLVTTVGSVREGSESVATASAEIAQGNSDLSARTEDQASSLEETSATMEELSATVRQNADSAQTANQLAQSASEVARNGGQVVGEVVNTMRGIETSSKRIADIIAVIDGIAFQTNILALNAAVEAARAGEQGRGFAVVASEVRNLAQRSADAAKEIKSLINDSVERVQSGTQLVDRAGQTMQDIVSSVQRVADIVGEISSASVEQSAGIAQVGEAITQLDRSTQQNAALVEQSAAASESMKVQAGRLLESVARFRLAAQQHAFAAPAAPLRKPAASSFGQKNAATSSAKPAARPASGSKSFAASPAAPRSPAQPSAPSASPSPAPKPAAKAAADNDGDWSEF